MSKGLFVIQRLNVGRVSRRRNPRDNALAIEQFPRFARPGGLVTPSANPPYNYIQQRNNLIPTKKPLSGLALFISGMSLVKLMTVHHILFNLMSWRFASCKGKPEHIEIAYQRHYKG
jgi:hypothetical protein